VWESCNNYFTKKMAHEKVEDKDDMLMLVVTYLNIYMTPIHIDISCNIKCHDILLYDKHKRL